ncbi:MULTISPECIES: YggN family protein [unclassified Lysobacter]|uniref:YggN family protein n=1 Tax=unclassified Lysobacter TaxID=2635362 RepID=UPI001F58B3B7|nr:MULTISPECIES: YggN family protein [unclassified Lysobacter]
MKAFAIVAFAAALPLLGACDERSSTPPPAPSANAAKPVPETVIGRSVEKAMDKARAKLATENISLTDFHVSGHHNGITVTTDEDPNDGRPKAEITPQGDLLIDGRRIEANAQQHALLLEYRKQIEAVAGAGMDIGVQGAELGVKAATEAIKGIFSGNPEDVEQRVEAEAEQIKLSARKLCDQLPAMLETQTALAAEMPEFRPYATMDQDDIDDCYDDEDTNIAQARTQVQRQTREEIRTRIRESIQAAAQGSGAVRDDTGMDAAAEAEEASIENETRQ